jgi:hypothetical protein
MATIYEDELNVCSLCGRAFYGTEMQTVCDECIAEVLYADTTVYAFSDGGPTEYVCA